MCQPWKPVLTRDRRSTDNTSTASSFHDRDRRLTREKYAFHIYGKSQIPSIFGHRFDSRVTDNAGITNENMQIAKLPAGFFNHVLSVTFLADVSLNCDRPSAKVNNFGHGALSSRQATDLWSAILLCQKRFGQIAHASKSGIWTPFS